MTYVDNIFEAFGGTREFARAVNRASSTVDSWRARGSIPDKNKVEVLSAARSLGIDLRPEHFFPIETDAAQ